MKYIQEQINKISNSVEDRQLAGQRVNKVHKREIKSRRRIKACSQKERIQKWIEHFNNQCGNPL